MMTESKKKKKKGFEHVNSDSFSIYRPALKQDVEDWV